VTYFNTPAQVAAALRAMADDLAAMPAAVLPDLAVTVDIQASTWGGTDAERIAAVDALSTALVGHPGQSESMPNGTVHHHMSLDFRYRADGLRVAVYTGLTDLEVAR